MKLEVLHKLLVLLVFFSLSGVAAAVVTDHLGLAMKLLNLSFFTVTLAVASYIVLTKHEKK